VKNTFDIVRTPSDRPFVGIVTSRKIRGCPVHYYGGRTVPHRVEGGCEPCEVGRSYRWMAYFACISVANGHHCIYEVTARVHARLQEESKRRGVTRGLKFKCFRPSGKLNGRVEISFAAKLESEHGLPSEPDVQAVMEHVWERCLDANLSKSARNVPNLDGNGRSSPPSRTPR